ncbi:MAG: hypothetical protein ACRDKZ_10625 [Actinomycetota bacterium]
MTRAMSSRGQIWLALVLTVLMLAIMPAAFASDSSDETTTESDSSLEDDEPEASGSESETASESEAGTEEAGSDGTEGGADDGEAVSSDPESADSASDDADGGEASSETTGGDEGGTSGDKVAGNNTGRSDTDSEETDETVTCPTGNEVTSASIAPGDATSTATFTVAEECENVVITFAGYQKPDAGLNLDNQTLWPGSVTAGYDAGSHTVSIPTPSCFFQLDLAYGPVLPVINNESRYGDRLIKAVHGGTGTGEGCEEVDDEEETPPVAAPAAVISNVECTEGGFTITYTNSGTAPASFVSTVNGSALDSLEVGPGENETREYGTSAFEDETIEVVVTSGTMTESRSILVDCVPTDVPSPVAVPAAQISDVDCTAGGLAVTYTNTGTAPATFTSTVNGQPLDSLVVSPAGTVVKEYGVAALEDQTIVIAVTSGNLNETRTLLVDCVSAGGPPPGENPPPEGPPGENPPPEGPPGENPPDDDDDLSPDDQVIDTGAEDDVLGQVAPPEQAAAAVLPFTGGRAIGFVLAALALIAAGLLLLRLRRRTEV